MALCAHTGAREIRQGVRTIVPTAVWVGEDSEFQRLNAGIGACDPAFSPDGRRLALTAADGLWIFPTASWEGFLIAESKVPAGEPTEYRYRAFSHPEWSPDGILVALAVSNGGTSWVEIFDSYSGRLFYTSPPESYSFKWGATARDIRVGNLDVRLPSFPPSGR